MHFNVAQLMRELGGSTRTYQVEDEPQAPDIFPTRSVRGTVKLMRTDSGVWVSAFLTSSAPSICSRCLEEYAQPVTAHLEEEFFPVWAEDSFPGLGRGLRGRAQRSRWEWDEQQDRRRQHPRHYRRRPAVSRVEPTDEAGMQRRMPRPLPDLWSGPEPDRLRLQQPCQRSTLGAALTSCRV
jgi:hypothetical protein